MRVFRSLTFIFGLALALSGAMAFVGPAQAQAQGAGQTQPTTTEPLEIVTASGRHVFAVEVMRTDEERARGLMFRRFMPADRGMLFDFKIEQPVLMWMKNTYIPLDMIFISRNGTVTSVAANTEPMSERTISSGPPAFAVLEVNAGVAAKIGLKPGDRVAHGLFGK
jgi:uncharacterized membrane protein (UPF0127 family)